MAFPARFCALALLLTLGCRQPAVPVPSAAAAEEDRNAIAAAIDRFSATTPSCVWSDPVAMPYRVGHADPLRRPGLDALTAAGLLLRQTAGGTSVYGLTPAGRAAWTPNRVEPGLGEFCYGARMVTAINETRQADNQVYGPALEVSYQAAYQNSPAWARHPAVRAAYPMLELELSRPLPHSATLVLRQGHWQAAAVPAGTVLEAGPGSAAATHPG